MKKKKCVAFGCRGIVLNVQRKACSSSSYDYHFDYDPGLLYFSIRVYEDVAMRTALSTAAIAPMVLANNWNAGSVFGPGHESPSSSVFFTLCFHSRTMVIRIRRQGKRKKKKGKAGSLNETPDVNREACVLSSLAKMAFVVRMNLVLVLTT